MSILFDSYFSLSIKHGFMYHKNCYNFIIYTWTISTFECRMNAWCSNFVFSVLSAGSYSFEPTDNPFIIMEGEPLKFMCKFESSSSLTQDLKLEKRVGNSNDYVEIAGFSKSMQTEITHISVTANKVAVPADSGEYKCQYDGESSDYKITIDVISGK